MNETIASLRRDYTRSTLDLDSVSPDPFRQFEIWLQQSIESGLEEPNAMTLATATSEGVPSCRIVLLRDISSGGFVFFTSYASRKGEELLRNPRASLLFFWAALERQIRIEGEVTRIAATESDAYFASRPRGSQLAAWASPQSAVIAGRTVLERGLAEFAARFPETVTRPSDWGGFRLRPQQFEFWQGRENRLHDRIRYSRVSEGRWLLDRLAP